MEAEIFGYHLTHGQLKIVGSVLDPDTPRLSVCAMTRYGKTRAVAIACLLYIMVHPNTKIAFIAPTRNQTSIIRNYIAEHIADTPQLYNLVDSALTRDQSALKREVSKRRVTFKNGCEIITLTAHGTGEQLMGFGADIIVVDEAALIADEVYTSRISRMLGDNPDSKLVEMVNPWHRNNFAYRHWQSGDFKKIHVDWRQALSEGRTTETFITQQRAELSQYEFEVLYDSVFAEDAEDVLIRWSWIQDATTRQLQLENVHTVWGLDVAEQGTDLTILTKCETDNIRYRHLETRVIKENTTMGVANHVAGIVPKNEQLNIDSIGIGAGVHSRLAELGYKAVSIRVSNAATRDCERYLNLKAQNYWRLRTLFEQGLISLNKHDKLMRELSLMRYEFTTAGKIKIIDPEQKSPDYSDSLMLCVSQPTNLAPAWVMM
jgi:hypothetical protein